MRAWQISSSLAMILFLAGCSGLKQDHTIDWSANRLFNAAKEEMTGGSYTSAIDYYTKFLSRYPYGVLAQQSMLDLAYVYYKDGDQDKAIAELDDFIRTYPAHPYIDYALYMKGVVEYEKDVSIFDRFVPTNMSETDPQALVDAFNSFAKVVREHPKSQYADDARQRMIYIRNLLGEHSLNIADFYLRQGAYVASVSRAKQILEQYETTPSAPYALAIMVRAYKEMGEDKLSSDSLRVLQQNFPTLMNDKEIQFYLNGKINTSKGIFQRYKSKPKT